MLVEHKILHGLPEEVRFCQRCVMSNQRPCSYPEFLHTPHRITPTLNIDEMGICDACKYSDRKQNIDWDARELELIALLDRYRRNDGSYDCLVPGSGGKDSCYAAHILKYKYGMHPLTVTWPPFMYTDYGYANFKNWIEVGGFDNITFKPNGRVHRLLTRLAIENLLHPFQTFILGQKNLAPKVAMQHGIELIFYGEPEAEYGNPIKETNSALRDPSYFTIADYKDAHIGGLRVSDLMQKYNLCLADLSPYFPLTTGEMKKFHAQVHYLGYYLKWTPQESYYYAVENCGFEARPFRTQGTYSKYNSIDDKIDDLHYYTTFIKFGLGRASYDASQEIRNRHLTREEGVKLVQRFDGEFPSRYFEEVLSYLEISPEKFIQLCDQARSPHLWKKENGEWYRRHIVS